MLGSMGLRGSRMRRNLLLLWICWRSWSTYSQEDWKGQCGSILSTISICRISNSSLKLLTNVELSSMPESKELGNIPTKMGIIFSGSLSSLIVTVSIEHSMWHPESSQLSMGSGSGSTRLEQGHSFSPRKLPSRRNWSKPRTNSQSLPMMLSMSTWTWTKAGEVSINTKIIEGEEEEEERNETKYDRM